MNSHMRRKRRRAVLRKWLPILTSWDNAETASCLFHRDYLTGYDELTLDDVLAQMRAEEYYK